MASDISALTRLSAVKNSPFVNAERKEKSTKLEPMQDNIAESQSRSVSKAELKQTVPDHTNSKERHLNMASNNLVDKQHANTSYIPSTAASSNSTSIIEILRNFDSKSKQEQVLFTSEKPARPNISAQFRGNCLMSQPKAEEFGTPKPMIETTGSVAEKLKMFNQLKKLSADSDSQPEKVELHTDVPLKSSKKEEGSRLTRSKSFSDRLKRFQSDEVLPVLPTKYSVPKPKTSILVDAVEDAKVKDEEPISTKPVVSLNQNCQKRVGDIVNNFNQQSTETLLVPSNSQKVMKPARSLDSLTLNPPKAANSELQATDMAANMPVIEVGCLLGDNSGWLNAFMPAAVEKELESESVAVNLNQEEVQETEPEFETKIEQPELSEMDDSLNEKVLPAKLNSDDTLDQIETTESLTVTPEPASSPKRPKKSVGFATAWDGSFSTTKLIPSYEVDNSSSENAIGRMFFNCVKIEAVPPPDALGAERTLEFTISQGSQSVTSPPLKLDSGITERAVDWQNSLNLTAEIPLSIILKIRELPSPLANDRLKRSLTTRNILKGSMKSLGSRLFGNLGRLEEIPEPRLKPSDSCASFSSISSFSFKNNSNLIQPTSTPLNVTVGQFIVAEPQHWVENFNGKLEFETINLAQAEWRKSRKGTIFGRKGVVESLGKLKIQLLYLPAHAIFNLDILPTSFAEYNEDQLILSLHKRIWKEGYLYQLGGDCDTWKMRYFKLVGDQLLGFHATTLELRVMIKLKELETINYFSMELEPGQSPVNADSNDFVLSFKDGRAISFRLPEDTSENGEKTWIETIEESHFVLSENPLPDWLC